MKWRTEPPLGHDNTRCLLTIQPDIGARCVTIGWAAWGEMMRGAVAWAPLPKHIAKCPDGWMSQYRGDNLPSKAGMYLVCFVRGNDFPEAVQEAWYNPAKNTFGSRQDYVAWMPIPKPFKGNVA